ncbi:hypothetical protein [Pantoea piersonii]|uniref:hypothetical protein n=1 Tax=Pantoea piersonii TaxID=2364647 RepID=UPI00289F11BC|nr:hypothetical protein [Pantoea piersonii]
MNELALEGIESNDEVITAATDHMAFFLFSILSDCYPEIATTEFENIFNDEFKADVENFIKSYRKKIGNRMVMSGKDLAQIYSNQRFYEKLSRALEQCKKDKAAFTTMNQVKAFQI